MPPTIVNKRTNAEGIRIAALVFIDIGIWASRKERHFHRKAITIITSWMPIPSHWFCFIWPDSNLIEQRVIAQDKGFRSAQPGASVAPGVISCKIYAQN